MTTRAAPSPRPRVEVVIDLDAIRHNVGILAGCAAASGAATMEVVKADGYGHGAVDVAEAALQALRRFGRVAAVRASNRH